MNKRLTGLVLTRGDVELKSMPGTGDDAAGKRAFAERPSLVRANAIEGVEVPIDVKERHNPLARDKLAASAGWNVGGFGNGNPV